MIMMMSVLCGLLLGAGRASETEQGVGLVLAKTLAIDRISLVAQRIGIEPSNSVEQYVERLRLMSLLQGDALKDVQPVVGEIFSVISKNEKNRIIAQDEINNEWLDSWSDYDSEVFPVWELQFAQLTNSVAPHLPLQIEVDPLSSGKIESYLARAIGAPKPAWEVLLKQVMHHVVEKKNRLVTMQLLGLLHGPSDFYSSDPDPVVKLYETIEGLVHSPKLRKQLSDERKTLLLS